MKVTLLSYSPEPEKLIASAAKLCYSPSSAAEIFDGLTEEKATAFIRKLKAMSHLTPMEQASFTFGIDGISKAASQHVTRHRLISVNQKSQRYVSEDDFSYYIPEPIKQVPEALDIYLEAMDHANNAYKNVLLALKQDGMGEKSRSSIEKKAFENARYVLPVSCDTSLMLKMNARELFHFFKLRCCNRALDETRELADEMLRLCKEVAPNLFEGEGAPCASGACPEGQMTCGNPKKR